MFILLVWVEHFLCDNFCNISHDHSVWRSLKKVSFLKKSLEIFWNLKNYRLKIIEIIEGKKRIFFSIFRFLFFQFFSFIFPIFFFLFPIFSDFIFLISFLFLRFFLILFFLFFPDFFPRNFSIFSKGLFLSFNFAIFHNFGAKIQINFFKHCDDSLGFYPKLDFKSAKSWTRAKNASKLYLLSIIVRLLC